MVVVWNTQNVSKDGDVSVLAKVHTEADISTMKVASFDDTRFLNFSCPNSWSLYKIFSVCSL